LADVIKNSTNYGLYIVEEQVGADAWFDDHDHIKELDWDQGTEGDDKIYLPYSGRLNLTPNFNIQILDFLEGAAVDLTLGEGHWVFTIKGRYGGTSAANRLAKKEALLTLFNDHLLFANGALFLGYRSIGEIWEPFVDASRNIKYYLKGKLLMAEMWKETFNSFYNWKIAFRGVW